ncbi:MAG: hypothetical protein ACLFVJ_11350 [Persicimonas sp.]
MKQKTKKFRWAVGMLLSCLAAGGLLVACNSHPVELIQASGEVSEHVDYSPGAAAEIDILWVIDNSGSMCEEQAALRDNFQSFIQDISKRNIDFHIGVTTTHSQSEGGGNFERVAREGELQSMPQPVVVADECYGENYSDIRSNIEVAVDTCSKTPSKWQHLKEVTDEEIECYLGIAGEECGENHEKYWKLFPTTDDGAQPNSTMSPEQSPYIDIPKVLKAEDYRGGEDNDGPLDVELLERHFSCMSFVGTTGNPFEKGIGAAIEVVSPEKTGGTEDNPTNPDAPNHGFLREDANTALIFVTDENDCTHDGTLPELTPCGGNVCAYATNPNLSDSPLLEPAVLADDFVSNVWQSKGGSAEDEEGMQAVRDTMVVASIHGRWQRYGEDYPDDSPPITLEACDDDYVPSEDEREKSSCSGEFGEAFSGDRYDRFLREFNDDSIFPSPDEGNPDDPLDWLICSDDPEEFERTMEALGEKVAGSATACFSDPPYECETSDDCFDHMFGEGTPECVQFAETSKKYCTSGLQVRMYPDPDIDSDSVKTVEDLEDNDYCLQESIDSVATPGGCVVKPEKYDMVTCSGKDDEMSLEWVEDTARRDLSGFNVELVYTIRSPEEEQANNANNAE